MGGVGNGAAEGRLALGFKPRHGTDEGAFWDHAALAEWGSHGLGSRREFARKKRGERTLAGGP